MRFWDSSAILPLLISERRSAELRSLAGDDIQTVWWGTEIECISAISRLERDRGLTAAGANTTLAGLELLMLRWNEVQPIDTVKRTSRRLLRVHALRAADALQLAAALAASENLPSSLEFVTLDDRLADAARREGFTIAPLR